MGQRFDGAENSALSAEATTGIGFTADEGRGGPEERFKLADAYREPRTPADGWRIRCKGLP